MTINMNGVVKAKKTQKDYHLSQAASTKNLSISCTI